VNSESGGLQDSEICKILLSEDSELFWLEDSELWRILNEFCGERALQAALLFMLTEPRPEIKTRRTDSCQKPHCWRAEE
jgi:hypothetical protein